MRTMSSTILLAYARVINATYGCVHTVLRDALGDTVKNHTG